MGTLRLILALSVVMSHGLTTLGGIPLFDGAGAVQAFFTISGFLITIALNRKYVEQDGALPAFYWNRLIRLYPAYWVWLLITIAAYFLLPVSALTRGFYEDGSVQASGFWVDHFQGSSLTTLALAIIANISGLFADSFLNLGWDRASGALVAKADSPVWAMAFVFIGQYWSIGVELCFYALAPWVVRRRLAIAALFFLGVSGWLERGWVAVGQWLHLHPALVQLQAPKYLWMFMLGAALAHLYMQGADAAPTRQRRWTWVLLAAMYACIAYRGRLFFPLQAYPWWLFAALTASLPLLMAKTSTNRYDKFAGDLSYPVYINHFLVIQVLSSFVAPNGLLYAFVTMALAAATVVFVERPAQKYRLPGSRRSRPAGDRSSASVVTQRQPPVSRVNDR